MANQCEIALIALALLSSLTGCQSRGQAPGPPAMPPPTVSVISVQPENVPIYHDYVAQSYARDMVEVRGRVDGYIEKRLFQVGSDVKAGQLLYTLDLRPYQAEVQKTRGELDQSLANLEFSKRQVGLIQAEADLAQAQANLTKAQQDVDRLQPLVKEEAAARQDLENALSTFQANQANVKARQANVEQNRLSTKAQIDTASARVESSRASLRTAELNLEYASIRAPIAGRVGDSLIQVGGLVSRNASQPLTTIVPLDPIWIRFKVSESEYLEFRRRLGGEKGHDLQLELALADNRPYPYPGLIQNTVNQVDPKTGTLELQASFPNPQRTILPGQFGRVRWKVDDRKSVLLVPQRAVQEMQGTQSVLTVGPENKVQVRTVVTGERIGERWIVLQGLKAGDSVIVEGVQKARPGVVVNPHPFEAGPAKQVGGAG